MLRNELNRPYMNMLALLALMGLALVLIFQSPQSIDFVSVEEPQASQTADPETVSTLTSAPSCAKAMRSPTDAQCQTYHDRLIEQGYVQLKDNSYQKAG